DNICHDNERENPEYTKRGRQYLENSRNYMEEATVKM
ncbi:hypothetical protein EVA_14624, partial [gut metagenome]